MTGTGLAFAAFVTSLKPFWKSCCGVLTGAWPAPAPVVAAGACGPPPVPLIPLGPWVPPMLGAGLGLAGALPEPPLTGAGTGVVDCERPVLVAEIEPPGIPEGA